MTLAPSKSPHFLFSCTSWTLGLTKQKQKQKKKKSDVKMVEVKEMPLKKTPNSFITSGTKKAIKKDFV